MFPAGGAAGASAAAGATVVIGSSRNLTQRFVQLRTEAKRANPAAATDDRATARLVGAALGSDVELGATPAAFAPAWVQKSERLRNDMNELKNQLVKLKELHGRALRVTFGTENDSRAHAEALTRDIQVNFKRLDQEVRGMGSATGGDDDAQVRLQVQRQLAAALFKLSVEFRKEETRFLNKVEAQKGLVEGSSIGLVESDSQVGLDNLDPGFTQAQLAMVDVSQALAVERDSEIRKIVSTIAELAQIMRDLSVLVVEQGTMLDRIDQNLVKVADTVEKGVVEVVKAEKTQKAGRMMLCIIALIVLIVIMLIIVIVRRA